MLTRLIVRNFKRFREVEVDLDEVVVFIGPNNSGKTSALQALALWQAGLSKWNEKRKGASEAPQSVTINRRDLVAVPVPEASLLWRDLCIRDERRAPEGQEARDIKLVVIVEGTTKDRAWRCGLEFDYANEESLYCRPLGVSEGGAERMPLPEEACEVRAAFLPPMLGPASKENETRLPPGAVNVLVGEGKTAEVLRNLCFAVYSLEDRERWSGMVDQIRSLFGVELEAPEYVPERGEIRMRYRERNVRLDLSSSGAGLQQTLLLLAYMYANPGSVLLLDEPDAHLEILRQRQTYQLLVDVARSNGSQVIAASHSEILLNEAAGRDTVVAFVGPKPHRIDNRGSQLAKALKEIPFEDYYLAEQTGWVLYLEGSTDLAMLQALSHRLHNDEAQAALARPFVHYVCNETREVSRHFHGLRVAAPDLKGIALFDRMDLPADLGAEGLAWRKREVENYVCFRETLEAFARNDAAESLLEQLHVNAMDAAIGQVEESMRNLDKGSPWDADTKVSDEFLVPLFARYYERLGLPNTMAKSRFYRLARFVPREKIDPEVTEKLDAIARVAASAQPAGELE